MSVAIRPCTIKDLKTLQKISYDTFYETFFGTTAEANLLAYLEKAFRMEQLEKEMMHPSSAFYFIYVNEELAGYLKVNVDSAQHEEIGDDSLEIERIYIRQDFQNQGLGQQLLNKGIELATAQQKTNIWLGVWEYNPGAIRFYERNGFTVTGRHSFYMGDEQQTDWIMTKPLNERD